MIEAWEKKEGSQRQLAQRFKVSLSFVRNLLRHYRSSGQVEGKRRGGYLRPIIDGERLQLVQRLLEEQNDAMLTELCERFRKQTGIRVSVPTMHRAVQRLRLSSKKTMYASEQDTPRIANLRYEFRHWLLSVDPRNESFC